MNEIFKAVLEFVEGKKREYEKEGLVPTLDLLIEDLKKLCDEDLSGLIEGKARSGSR